MDLTIGSGSCYFRHWRSRCQTKTNFYFVFFCLLWYGTYYFLKVHLHHFSKKKNQKESQNSQGLSYSFCMLIEGSGSGFIPLTNGSEWHKNMWIHNTALRKTYRLIPPLTKSISVTVQTRRTFSLRSQTCPSSPHIRIRILTLLVPEKLHLHSYYATRYKR